MKNETISRLILILEIGAIILFHSLKSNPPSNQEIVSTLNQTDSISYQQPPQIVLTVSQP